MTESNLHPMERLKRELEQILTAIPRKSRIIYMEYPVYNNVGDLLIMKGTERFFKDNEIEVVARYSFMNFRKKVKLPQDCIIVCQGGGNFGDLYRGPQQLREYLVGNYPDNRIVILPQTIYYKSKENLKETAAIFNKHKDVHLFVRDEKSYEIIKNEFNVNAYLSPDMAHQLWPIHVEEVAKKEVLHFIRTDDEINLKLEGTGSPEGDILDWPVLLSKLDHKTVNMFQFISKIDRVMFNILPIHKLWEIYSDYLVNKSIKVFGEYQCISTSRLHGHILSCLMNKENVVIDNSYGKNSTYYDRWTKICDNVTLKK